MRMVAAILISAVLGIGLAAGATAAIVTTNAPDKDVEATFKGETNVKQRDVVPYGQR
ncbi:hypothetical protein [Virgisporangium aurantiacum]|uniref:DUF2613 domain-containing protein n=1 Tax=Virgisporangium aurantiacum TaxID=175570 RepID=A0A8J4E3V8_9ACTN|nr:hypothetical protein [Virgisporangium aurantiacum]GIJ58377.1 hypothetical protein Vau01_058930 [Virgisporangium aurantiacum]